MGAWGHWECPAVLLTMQVCGGEHKGRIGKLEVRDIEIERGCHGAPWGCHGDAIGGIWLQRGTVGMQWQCDGNGDAMGIQCGGEAAAVSRGA